MTIPWIWKPPALIETPVQPDLFTAPRGNADKALLRSMDE